MSSEISASRPGNTLTDTAYREGRHSDKLEDYT